MPRDTSKTIYTTSLNAELIKKFRIYCTANGKYQNEILEHLIETFLNNQGGEVNYIQNDQSFVSAIRKELSEVKELVNNLIKEKPVESNTSKTEDFDTEVLPEIQKGITCEPEQTLEGEIVSDSDLSENERLEIEKMVSESMNLF